MKSALRTFYVLLMITPILLLPVLTMVGCQEKPEPSPTPFTPTNNTSEPQPLYIPNQIIVKFKSGISIEAQEQLHEDLRTTVIHTSPSAGFQVLQIPEGKSVPEMIAIYSEKSIVEYAEPNYIERISPESQS